MSAEAVGPEMQKDPVNILLVDDQPGKLLSYETILGGMGETLLRANSGTEALEQLLRHEVAVVLVDVCMPELDGFELAAMIRQHPRYQKTAIILVSGVLVEDADRLKGYGSGAVDYVSVPIVPEILRAKVAVFAELFRKTRELHRLNRELESRVAERTSEINAAAERLRQNEERLRLALSASRMRSWTWDIKRDVISTATEPAGPETDVGSLDHRLELTHPSDRRAVREAFDRAVDGGGYNVEFRVREAGEERWMMSRGTLIRDARGEPISLTGIDVDITGRKRAEEERTLLLRHSEEARREAEDANRLKDEFLATLSHELRTPLNAITGWAHLLDTGALDAAERRKAIETITRNVQLQTRLISDILDVSRIVTGKMRLLLQPVDVRGIVQAAADALRPAFGAKRIELRLDLADPGQPLPGDPERLQQVVWNLLSNAIKFTPTLGEVGVRLTAGEGQIEIVVEDNGPGIREDFLPFIFDRFRQADGSSTRAHQGLGLGLAIARHLVDMHGGTIEARNRPDAAGAQFRVVLPRRLALSEAGMGLQDPHKVSPASGPEWFAAAPSLVGTRVLIVDDEPDSAEVIAVALAACGAEVETAGSAAEAYERFMQRPPSVLISDIGMPLEDGYQLLARIRALPTESGRETPAAALTAYAGAHDRMKVLRAGFDMHVPKPVEPAEIASLVARLARLRR
jgi:signal transduction histidine kinase/DNA-binding response OmpR family regulator